MQRLTKEAVIKDFDSSFIDKDENIVEVIAKETFFDANKQLEKIHIVLTKKQEPNIEIDKLLIATKGINNRMIYDIKTKNYEFVNQLIYWENELMIAGYLKHYKVADYGITWKLDGEVEEDTEILMVKKKEVEE